MNRAFRIDPRRLAVNDSYTFLMKELEKVDNEILEPLSGTTHVTSSISFFPR